MPGAAPTGPRIPKNGRHHSRNHTKAPSRAPPAANPRNSSRSHIPAQTSLIGRGPFKILLRKSELQSKNFEVSSEKKLSKRNWTWKYIKQPKRKLWSIRILRKRWFSHRKGGITYLKPSNGLHLNGVLCIFRLNPQAMQSTSNLPGSRPYPL